PELMEDESHRTGVHAPAAAEAESLELLQLGIARRLAPDGAHDDRADREALLPREDAKLLQTRRVVLRESHRYPVPAGRRLRPAMLRVPALQRDRRGLRRLDVFAAGLAGQRLLRVPGVGRREFRALEGKLEGFHAAGGR